MAIDYIYAAISVCLLKIMCANFMLKRFTFCIAISSSLLYPHHVLIHLDKYPIGTVDKGYQLFCNIVTHLLKRLLTCVLNYVEEVYFLFCHYEFCVVSLSCTYVLNSKQRLFYHLCCQIVHDIRRSSQDVARGTKCMQSTKRLHGKIMRQT